MDFIEGYKIAKEVLPQIFSRAKKQPGKSIENMPVTVGKNIYVVNIISSEEAHSKKMSQEEFSPELKNTIEKKIEDTLKANQESINSLPEPERELKFVETSVSSIASVSRSSSFSVSVSKSGYRSDDFEGSGLGVMDPSGEQATMAVNIGPVPPKKYDFDDGEGM